MSSSSLRFLARALSSRLHRSLGLGGALVGFGYGLSFDKPLSYVPYGVCRSYEGLSEALPGLRDRRLGVYDRASRFAERWRMESPFLNAYLLDRLCRESVTRHRRLQQLAIDTPPPPPPLPQPEDITSVPSPRPSVEVKPVQHVNEEPKSINSKSSDATDPSSTSPPSSSSTLTTSASNDDDSNTSTTPVAIPSNDPIRPSIVDEWSKSISDFGQRSRQRLSLMFSPSFLIAKSHDLLFPGAAKEPSYLSVLDRVHHLTTSLEPHCSDVDRLRSVYITLANFLNFTIQQKAFHEQLFHESSLEHDKLILQFFHSSLLATHRMEYLNEYERLAVTPAPPPSLPTGELTRPAAPTLWKKTTTTATSTMKGLVSNFNPSSDQKSSKTQSPSSSTTTPSTSSQSDQQEPSLSASVLHRRRPSWTAQDAAMDCRLKMRNVWRIVGRSRLLKNAAVRTVWRGEYFPSHLEQVGSLHGSFDDANQRTPAQMALESKIARESEEVVGLTGAIRSLIQDFNRTPTTANDTEVCFEMNKAIQTPLTLNPFGEQYSPYRFSQFIQQWILHGPLIPFVVGAALTALYLSPTFTQQMNKDSGEPLASRLWSSITSLFDGSADKHPSQPSTAPQSYPQQPQQFATDASSTTGTNYYGMIPPSNVMDHQSMGFMPSAVDANTMGFGGVNPSLFGDGFVHPVDAFIPPDMSHLMQRGFNMNDPRSAAMIYNSPDMMIDRQYG